MRDYSIRERIWQSPDGSDTIYIAENGIYVWDVTIDAGVGGETVIAHLSDLHFNYCNERDFADAEPVLMSTYEHRLWLRDAASVPLIRRCLAMTEDADAHIFNGDTLDYLSHGAMELMDQEIWDKYPDCIANLGGHELARQMQGEVPDPLTRDQKLAILTDYWRHDIYYTSKVIKGKVMLIGFLNDCGLQTPEQIVKLKADLQTAREKGYAVLLFAHEPMITHNPAYQSVGVEDLLLPGDLNGFPYNYYDGTGRARIPGGAGADKTALAFYDIILNSADVIRGFFAGHIHDDFKLEILARTPDGEMRSIPQYVHNTSAIGDGHFMRILVK